MAKCLILSDAEGRLSALRPLLETHGLIAVPEPVDAELFCAREAGRGLFLLGAGEGCTRALFLAERYPVQGLILIGRPARPRPSSSLWRRVERDVLVIQPLADRTMPPRAAETVLRAVSSRRRERLDMGQDRVDLWTNCAHLLAEAIAAFICPQSNGKMLALKADPW